MRRHAVLAAFALFSTLPAARSETSAIRACTTAAAEARVAKLLPLECPSRQNCSVCALVGGMEACEDQVLCRVLNATGVLTESRDDIRIEDQWIALPAAADATSLRAQEILRVLSSGHVSIDGYELSDGGKPTAVLKLPDDLIAGFRNLSVLKLRNVSMQNVELPVMPRIHTLDFSGDGLTDLNAKLSRDVLAKSTLPLTLVLERNLLVEIPSIIFALPNLRVLRLQHNAIKHQRLSSAQLEFLSSRLTTLEVDDDAVQTTGCDAVITFQSNPNVSTCDPTKWLQISSNPDESSAPTPAFNIHTNSDSDADGSASWTIWDLFAGLPLDYAFLDDASPLVGTTAPATSSAKENAAPKSGDAPHLLFEHDLSLGGFAFPAYRPAPQHRHKRVRSNPDVLFGFQHALLSANGGVGGGGNGTSAVAGGGGGGLDPVAEMMPPVAMDESMGMPMQLAPRANLVALQEPVPMAPIGPVQVTTPVGLHAASDTTSTTTTTATTSPIPFQTQTSGDESFKDMDEFLQDLSWAEIPTDMAQPMDVSPAASSSSANPLVDPEQRAIEASPVAYRSQRIQEGVQELKMKRKRPQHARHHSNPVDLLHNLDQFRILAQQTKQQQQLQHLQQQDPSSVLNPFAVPPSSGVVPFHPQQQQQLPPSPPQQSFNQFQVPPQIASGAARSLHSRRSSLPNATGPPNGSSATVPPRAAARRAQRSSGLSMDLSQMNLGFLSVPEEDFQSHPFQQEFSQAVQQAGAPSRKPAVVTATATATATAASTTETAAATADDASRKLYKCGRCGQPKVGHICTMPDQRNNWTQVDLDVTKGIKVMRVNCHIMPVKNRWVTQDEENLQDEQLERRHVSMISA